MNDAEYKRRRRWENRILNAILVGAVMCLGLLLFSAAGVSPTAGLLLGLAVGVQIVDHQQKMRDHVLGDGE